MRERIYCRTLLPLNLALLLVAQLPAQQPLVRPALIDTQKDCVNCHFPGTGQVVEPGFQGDAPFCLREEGAIWQLHDKHQQSLYLLLKPDALELTNRILGFGIRIEEVLAWDIIKGRVKAVDSNQQVEFETLANVRFRPGANAEHVDHVRECLACHAPLERTETVSGVASSLVESSVSCQVCHGPGSLYVNVHQRPVWRVVPALLKEQRFGLVDVRNPVKRAQLCNSCHIGHVATTEEKKNGQADRVVKHEWYAAGHPPLPGFEFATFSGQMPMHWRPLVEKLATPKPFDYFQSPPPMETAQAFLDGIPRSVELALPELAQSYLDANRGSFSAAPQMDAARTKDVLISGLAALSSYAAMLEHWPANGQPEFSLYDCGACHHELRSKLPSDARVRREVLAGRPPPAFWTLALARLGAGAAGGTAPANLQAALQSLDGEFSARPFGAWPQVNSAAAQLKLICDQSAAAIAAKPLDNAAAAAVLARLARPEHDVERDYHSARQYAWGAREVIKDLCGVPHRNYVLAATEAPQPPESFVPETLVQLLGGARGAKVPAEHEKVRERIDALFDQSPATAGEVNWHLPLRLRLPAGQDQQVRENLEAWLEAIATYDATMLDARLKPIRDAFPLP